MISINATLIVQIINLLLLIFILNKVMFQPIKKIVAQRAEQIGQEKTEVETIEQGNQDGQAAYTSDLKKGRLEVRQKLDGLRRSTEKEVNAILEEAQEQGKHHQVAVLSRIDEELSKTRADIRDEAEKVAATMAARILGREVS